MTQIIIKDDSQNKIFYVSNETAGAIVTLLKNRDYNPRMSESPTNK